MVKVAQGKGFELDRQRGDHYIMSKPGCSRPLVIPKKNQLKEDIVLGLIKTMGLSRKDFLKITSER